MLRDRLRHSSRNVQPYIHRNGCAFKFEVLHSGSGDQVERTIVTWGRAVVVWAEYAKAKQATSLIHQNSETWTNVGAAAMLLLMIMTATIVMTVQQRRRQRRRRQEWW